MKTSRAILRLNLLAVAALLALWAAPAYAADWVFAPGQYTHSPETGERVAQYAPVGPVYFYPDPSYVKSGYRHTRSSSSGQNGARHLHVVEEWGNEVRPYGEWQFPYRPYSVPYQLWGEPYAGLAPDVVNYGPVFPPRGGRPDHGGRRPDHGGGYPDDGHHGDHGKGHGGGGGWGGGGAWGGGAWGGGGVGWGGGWNTGAACLPFGAYPVLPPPYGGICPPAGAFDDYQFLAQ